MLSDEFKPAAARRHKGREVDNLLIITAPRERMVLVCLALSVLAAVVWVAFGSVDRIVSFDCVIHRSAPDRPWRATLMAAPTVAQFIDSGMAARVEVVASGRAAPALQGKVVQPAEVCLREELAARLPWPGDGARRIDIDIAGAAFPAQEGSRCRVSIPLGRQSIADLLGFRPS